MQRTESQNLTDSKVSARLSSFELLRILAMIIIIAHHFSVHGGFEFATDSITIPRLWIQFIQMGGKIGVDVFILISGYFLINTPRIKICKIIKLWLQLLTYSLSIYAIFVVAGLTDFSMMSFIKSCLPVTFGGWRFASTYFVLYLISPFVNKFLKDLDKKTFQCLLVLLFIIWCFIPTITNQRLQSNNLLWFIYLYAISAYIRLWHNNSKLPTYIYHLLAIGMVILTFLSAVVFDLLGVKISFLGAHATHFYGMQHFPILFISISMFLGFKGLNIKYSKPINIISASTFGIYLIHENGYVRPFFWLELFKNATYSDTIILIPYSIGVIFLVFVGCSCIELLRIHVLEKNYMKLINKMEPSINSIIEKFYSIKLFDLL